MEEIIGDIVGEDEAAEEEQIVQQAEGVYLWMPGFPSTSSPRFGLDIPKPTPWADSSHSGWRDTRAR